MLFNSVDFIVFALIFFLFYPLVTRVRHLRFLYITVASFIFYGWWDWHYLTLIVVSGLIDFGAGYCIHRYEAKKRWFLALSLLGNLGILFAFKYSIWLSTSVEQLFAWAFSYDIEIANHIPPFMWVLPVGISFYTFQSLSYTIDIYRGKLKPTRNPLLFFSYLSMFPQLVAGPIVRAEDIIKQLDHPNPVDSNAVLDGLTRIARGVFKKVVIADSLAPFVNSAFASSVGDHGGLYWWVAVTGFAVQIYCDFSGYSDIAIGLAKWMGINFRQNFNHPYISSSFKEFWTRWHISLSLWFRDYVYIPLGGSRTSAFRGHVNMWVAMLVSGFWHGAAWNFVIWGAVHACLLSLERIWDKPAKAAPGMLRSICSIMFTLLFVWIAWVFFRSTSLSQALGIIGTMFDVRGFVISDIYEISTICMVLMLVFFLRETFVFVEEKMERQIKVFDAPVIQSLTTAILLATSLYYRGTGDAFIYFQF